MRKPDNNEESTIKSVIDDGGYEAAFFLGMKGDSAHIFAKGSFEDLKDVFINGLIFLHQESGVPMEALLDEIHWKTAHASSIMDRESGKASLFDI